MDKSPHCFVCSRAAGASQGPQAGYEQMENRRKPNPCLIHPPLHPCPCCVPCAASLSRGHLQLHMKSSPSNQELCSLCFHFKASFFPFAEDLEGWEKCSKPKVGSEVQSWASKRGLFYMIEQRAQEPVRATPPCKSGHLFSEGKKAFPRFRASGQKSKSI